MKREGFLTTFFPLIMSPSFMSNILDAIVNLVNNPVVHLREYYHGRNRANNVGDALEEYVKDMFAGTFGVDEKERIEKISETFSYLGNNSNPPDAMLKNGDAIEVKKIESFGSALALNSSYPKHSLKSSSPMISKACRNAEKWLEKDIIYIVGIVDKSNNNLCQLCMVYGRNYCADEDCYSRIKTKKRRPYSVSWKKTLFISTVLPEPCTRRQA